MLKIQDWIILLVVLGAEKEKLTELVLKNSVMHCYNDNYKDGMLSSVICGCRNVSGEADAVMIFQGDQPLIKPKSINAVIDAYRRSEKSIVIPVYNKRRGHPLLIDNKYRDDIEKLDPSKGLRSLALLFPDDVLEVEINDPGILRDFDTYEEYIIEIN